MKLMNKKGAGTDIMLFIIFSFAICLIAGIFIFIGGTVNEELHEKLDVMEFGDRNGSDIVDESMGGVDRAYQSLYWISWFLIIGMIMSIFIGSYMVSVKPIFIVPFIILYIIAFIVSVGMSNAYEIVIANPTMSATFSGMLGANFIMANLPIWVIIIGITSTIIMFVVRGQESTLNQGGSLYG